MKKSIITGTKTPLSFTTVGRYISDLICLIDGISPIRLAHWESMLNTSKAGINYHSSCTRPAPSFGWYSWLKSSLVSLRYLPFQICSNLHFQGYWCPRVSRIFWKRDYGLASFRLTWIHGCWMFWYRAKRALRVLVSRGWWLLPPKCGEDLGLGSAKRSRRWSWCHFTLIEFYFLR